MSSTIHLLILLIGTATYLESTNAGGSVVAWHQWKRQHAKQYVDSSEEGRRRAIWQQQVDEITQHNLRFKMGLESYKQGLNQFSDLTWDELEAIYLKSLDLDQAARVEGNHHELAGSVDANDLPDSIDWREKGYVTDVKNQGACGSCWTFSATGTMEGQLANKTKQNATSLSEQQIVDCDTGGGGCDGGWPAQALAYTKENGLQSWTDYPYTAKKGKCVYDASKVVFKNEGGFLYSPGAGEDNMKIMVGTRGPVSIAIQVTNAFFRYASGVFNTTECTPGQVNHGVLAVGYGSESCKDYWLVKNSWGPGWGLGGYIKMARNNNNMCSVASYPVVAII